MRNREWVGADAGFRTDGGCEERESRARRGARWGCEGWDVGLWGGGRDYGWSHGWYLRLGRLLERRSVALRRLALDAKANLANLATAVVILSIPKPQKGTG